MPKPDFLPHNDYDFISWHNMFHQAAMAAMEEEIIAKEDVDLIERDNAAIRAKSDALDLAAAVHKRATAEKNEAIGTGKVNARAIARRIKAGAKYTPAVGARFGIESHGSAIDLNSARPNLAGMDRTGGTVELTFTKFGADGVNIYCQREGDTDWVFLSFAPMSPFLDIRALLQAGKPEMRRYCAVYVVKGREIGQFSDDVVIACAP